MKFLTLGQQARWIRPARRWLAASAIVAGLGIAGGQILPRLARLNELNARQRGESRHLAAAQTQLVRLSSLRQSAALIAPGGNFTSNPDAWIRRVTDLSASHRLQAVTVQTGVADQNGKIARLPLILSFDGSYPDAAAFLTDAEKLPAVVRVGTLHLHCTNLPTGQVEVQVAMNAYVPENP